MEAFLHIDISDSEFYYPLFYKLAFLAGFLIVLGIGIRRKYPLGTWILLNSIATVFAIIGSKVGTFGIEEWQSLFETGILPDTGRKTAFGAMIFGLVGLMISKKMLDFKAPVLDAYVWSVPVAMILQRIGCLFAGCCYGLPYDGVGAVIYQNPGHLLYNQINSGLLPFGENATLPVHNIPLYFIISSVGILLIISILHKKFKNKTALGLFGLGLILGTRFFIEFFRDPATNHVLFGEFLGIKMIQWALLGATFSLFGIAYYLSAFHKKSTFNATENPLKTARGIAVLSLLVFLLNDWFVTVETIVIHAKLVMSVSVIIFLQIRAGIKTKSFRFAHSPALMIVLSFFVMSQTYTFNRESGDEPISSAELRFSGANLGKTDYNCIQTGTGCGGSFCVLGDSLRPIGPQYFNTTMAFERISESGKRAGLVYGMEGNLEGFRNSDRDYSRYFGNLKTYVGVEGRKYFGVRVGLRVGKIYNAGARIENINTFYPTFSTWFGNKNVGTIKIGILEENVFGGSPSKTNIEMTINGKFIHDRFESLSVGLMDVMSLNNSIYGKAKFRLNKNYTINPGFGWVYQDDISSSLGGFFTIGVSRDLEK